MASAHAVGSWEERAGEGSSLAARPLAVAALAAIAACGRPSEQAVIGVVYQGAGEAVLRVARDEVGSWPDQGTAIRFVADRGPGAGEVAVEVERARRLAGVPGLVGVVGHAGSRGSLAAAPVYDAARVPHLVPTGTSGLLRDAGPWTFTLAPGDSVEGAFIARFAVHGLGARRVTLFYTTDEYGEGLRDGVRRALAENGADLLDEVPFAPTSDMRVLVEASLRVGTPDVVVSAGQWRETAYLARAVTARVPGARLIAGDGALYLPQLADTAGAAASALYLVAFWLPDTSVARERDYVQRYRRVAGREPSGPHAMWHDALILLATAAREVGADPEAIQRYLRELGRSRPPFAGVTGSITFLPDRTPRLLMARLEDGALAQVNAP